MTLIIGYGNPGRRDDGLGPELIQRLSSRDLPGVTLISDFQLKVEHAVLIAGVSRVVFVDASLTAPPPFTFDPLEPAESGDLSSHDVSPDTVLALARLHFGATVPGFVLAIAGSEFGYLQDGLSAGATANLDASEAFLLRWLADPEAV